MERAIATLFGAGQLKPAPGTWASAIAILVGLGLYRLGHFPLLAVATVLVTLLGFWAVRRATSDLTEKDPSEIVIDEVAGQWLALCFPAFGFWLMGLPADRFPYPGWLGAFIFFRLFDIWKPWLVGRADRRGDADGVMLDDLWAGLFAGFATMIAAGVAHGLFM
ncbi:phosphatidylglycerophosphatase A [Paracoccus sp. (in: a-proteobacteria)]|uniref:phosphatidylglycerophosphatase A family protein n=1 Tax=Paracoccus sp. TaxID=267 RepID=UPI00289BB2AE|nr:phosphatidylglycerophosphatase A [Paracoccus sp. (in: a-proteobacteria)]